jgi:hypothetical protein
MLTTNHVKGGRTILGLAKGWVASHRTAKGVEIGVAGHRRRVRFVVSFDGLLLTRMGTGP